MRGKELFTRLCTRALVQEAARLLRDRALDALKAAAVAQAESARLRAQLMLRQPAHSGSPSKALVGSHIILPSAARCTHMTDADSSLLS